MVDRERDELMFDVVVGVISVFFIILTSVVGGCIIPPEPPRSRLCDVVLCDNEDDCDEGEVCNEESVCVPVPEVECVRGSDCDEPGNDCNIDRCFYGVCVREPSDALCASGYVCNTAGDCVPDGECDNNGDCEDGIVCTTDVCIYQGTTAAYCDFRPNDANCEDYERCSAEEGCIWEGWVECETSGDCSDGIVCTANMCVRHLCRFEDNCDDGFVCSSSEQECVPVVTPECYDAGDCDDDVDCTADTCADGECLNTPVNSRCNDSNICTTDTCTATGCSNTPHDSACADGEHCSVTEGCVECMSNTHCVDFEFCNAGYECESGCGSCDDGVACTTDICTASGCANIPNDTLCSASMPICLAGRGCVECEHDEDCGADEFCDADNACYDILECEADAECNDSIVCTTNDCDTSGTCIFTPDDDSCDDGVYCTLDTCSLITRGCTRVATNSRCGSSLPYCHTTMGCVECLISSQCGSGETCSLSNVCVSSCGSCDDGIACTDDNCLSTGVCEHDPVDGWCASGICMADHGCVECETDSNCLASEHCSSGYVCVDDDECVYDSDCNDSIACTLDDCVSSGACAHEPRNSYCPSGQYCNAELGCRTISGTDSDSDGIPNVDDNCVYTANPRQEDIDGDRAGDVCDCDADGDGYNGFCCGGEDCNDYNAAIHPGAIERCYDGIDNDCDDYIDETGTSHGGCSY